MHVQGPSVGLTPSPRPLMLYIQSRPSNTLQLLPRPHPALQTIETFKRTSAAAGAEDGVRKGIRARSG